nr:ATP-binding cassette domain-containing protein [Gordonia desulfuricans]
MTKTFTHHGQSATVLNSIDLEVDTGTVFAVVGPSGAGKTTLARCINLLEQPTSGRVVVGGQELTGLKESQLRSARRRIGTVFQASSVLSRRTAAGNVALPLECLGVTPAETKARVSELLDRVGLSHRSDHYPHQLSGGQRQRVGIARALALRPSVLLADEATSGLDPETTASIVDLLDELRRDLDLTILAITHDMSFVRNLADSVARLDHGKIVEQGDIVDLLTDPVSELGRGLLPSVDVPAGQPDRQLWRVLYRDAHAARDWIERLSRAIRVPVELQSAAVEVVNGVQIGQAVVSVAARNGLDIAGLLSEWGLEAIEVSDANSEKKVEVAA